MKVIFKRHEGDTWMGPECPLAYSGLCGSATDTLYSWRYWMMPLSLYERFSSSGEDPRHRPVPRELEV